MFIVDPTDTHQADVPMTQLTETGMTNTNVPPPTTTLILTQDIYSTLPKNWDTISPSKSCCESLLDLQRLHDILKEELLLAQKTTAELKTMLAVLRLQQEKSDVSE